MSQIPKITSKKWTGTWNASRITTFQGQSVKRRSKKKNFESGQNQRNAMLIFITIHKQFFYCFTSTSVADSENHIKKVNRKLECQQNYNIPRPVCETSVKKEKLWKRRKSTKCYVHFHNFPESSAKNFVLFHIASVADSQNHTKKVNRKLECQQNDNIPRSVCDTLVQKENFESGQNQRNALSLWTALL